MTHCGFNVMCACVYVRMCVYVLNIMYILCYNSCMKQSIVQYVYNLIQILLPVWPLDGS